MRLKLYNLTKEVIKVLQAYKGCLHNNTQAKFFNHKHQKAINLKQV